jgi:hypothetical protein
MTPRRYRVLPPEDRRPRRDILDAMREVARVLELPPEDRPPIISPWGVPAPDVYTPDDLPW